MPAESYSQQDLDAVLAHVMEHACRTTISPCSSPGTTHEPWYLGSVAITGPWQREVFLALQLPLAEHLTAILTGTTATPHPADVADAVGEITNLVAGGVKGMTPLPGCDLTTPVVSREHSLPGLQMCFYSTPRGVCALAVTD